MTPRAPAIQAFEDLPAIQTPEGVRGKNALQRAVVSCRLRDIVTEPMALLIFEKATKDADWPRVRGMLLEAGHYEADVDYVVAYARKFRIDYDRLAAESKKGQRT